MSLENPLAQILFQRGPSSVDKHYLRPVSCPANCSPGALVNRPNSLFRTVTVIQLLALLDVRVGNVRVRHPDYQQESAQVVLEINAFC